MMFLSVGEAPRRDMRDAAKQAGGLLSPDRKSEG